MAAGTSIWLAAVLVVVPGAAVQDKLYMQQLGTNVSDVLNALMDEAKYDRRIRPGFGGAPTQIRVNLVIKSMGPISEKDEEFILDCYFRQMWVDRRLRFNGTDVPVLSMNWLFLEKVWKPDTYFLNGKKSYLHKITVPNKFLRIKQNGELTYSMRLTIKGSCPMHLKKFPLDSQLCPLEIGSYGYSTDDVIYIWDKARVVLNDGVSLAQYDVQNITTFESRKRTRRREEISTLVVHFHLKRLTGYFLLQVYIPCVLIVSCSWVSFWITKRDVPGRVTLGVTTVLTMTTLGFGSRSNWPRVSYATALDWWVIMCFAFVFASMVEFATINFIEKRLKDKKTRLEELQMLYTERHKRMMGLLGHHSTCNPADQTSLSAESADTDDIAAAQMEFAEFSNSAPRPVAEPTTDSLIPTLFGKHKAKCSFEYVMNKLERLTEKDKQDRFSVVDIYARLIFPVLFGVLNTLYWVLYLYYITDEKDDGVFFLSGQVLGKQTITV